VDDEYDGIEKVSRKLSRGNSKDEVTPLKIMILGYANTGKSSLVT
jgi:ribosome biogenesis GTPase A